MRCLGVRAHENVGTAAFSLVARQVWMSSTQTFLEQAQVVVLLGLCVAPVGTNMDASIETDYSICSSKFARRVF